MSSTQSFLFVSKDILNSGIRHISGNVPFYTQTETGWFNKKQTTVLHGTSGDQGGAASVLGVIDWKHEEFEVHGQRKKLSEICYKPGWLMSKTREWTWGVGAQKFSVEWENNTWIMETLPQKSREAMLSPFASHWFTKDEAATVEISPKADQFHVVFMILILCYMETKRLEQRRNAGNAAVISAVQ
ncbi:hypothetical protein DL96DRAFT_1627069 [Flagelloscypha sp. PMI_526]|nr:hypothetical protein DL96DRAFT_1627069 [Flagelloscypha sp. PMI_526]